MCAIALFAKSNIQSFSYFSNKQSVTFRIFQYFPVKIMSLQEETTHRPMQASDYFEKVSPCNVVFFASSHWQKWAFGVTHWRLGFHYEKGLQRHISNLHNDGWIHTQLCLFFQVKIRKKSVEASLSWRQERHKVGMTQAKAENSRKYNPCSN